MLALDCGLKIQENLSMIVPHFTMWLLAFIDCGSQVLLPCTPAKWQSSVLRFILAVHVTVCLHNTLIEKLPIRSWYNLVGNCAVEKPRSG